MPRTAKGAHRHTELEVIQTLKKEGLGSSRSIGEILNLSPKWVEDKLRLLYAAGRIYISEWKKFGRVGDYRVYYSLKETGDEVDEPKPKPLTPTQKTTNYRRRKALANLLGISK